MPVDDFLGTVAVFEEAGRRHRCLELLDPGFAFGDAYFEISNSLLQRLEHPLLLLPFGVRFLALFPGPSTRDSGLGTRDSGPGTRDSGFGTRDSAVFARAGDGGTACFAAEVRGAPVPDSRVPGPEPRAAASLLHKNSEYVPG